MNKIYYFTYFDAYLHFFFNFRVWFCVGGGDSNKGKSKKWRKILQFPHISQCIGLKDKLGEFLKSKIQKLEDTDIESWENVRES